MTLDNERYNYAKRPKKSLGLFSESSTNTSSSTSVASQIPAYGLSSTGLNGRHVPQAAGGFGTLASSQSQVESHSNTFDFMSAFNPAVGRST